MSDHTYRIAEIVGSSPQSVDQAIRNGLERADATLRHLDWFEVKGIRGHLQDGQVGHFQVTMKVGFRLEEPGGRGIATLISANDCADGPPVPPWMHDQSDDLAGSPRGSRWLLAGGRDRYGGSCRFLAPP